MLNIYHHFDWNYNCIHNVYCRCYRCFPKNHFITFKQYQKIYFDRNVNSDEKVQGVNINKVISWIKEHDAEWQLFEESSIRLKNMIPDKSSPESEKKNHFIISYLSEKYNSIQIRTEDYLARLLNKIRSEENIKLIDISESNKEDIIDKQNK